MKNMKFRRLLDPIDRTSEILFGIIMAVTIVGTVSLASTANEQARAATRAALGCNLAWGLVDAVMYLLRLVTARTRNRVIASQIASADSEAGFKLVSDSLPDYVAAISGPEEIAGMRRRLLTLNVTRLPLLHAEDFAAATAIFLLVVIATFPVALPFLVTQNTQVALASSRGIAVAMLFALGATLGRYAGVGKPAFTGALMAILGVVLIVIVMALGG
ncbi:hypothetical protein [Paraburkholderia aromaticivorans]|nr:hypothetical protein [Paraburkholderia aromaticivorans]